MADTTIVANDLPTGWTVYTPIRNAEGAIWNGTAFVPYSVGDWSSYATATPETPSASGTYVCQFPLTAPPGSYTWTLYKQVGGSPSSTDPPVSLPSDPTFWNGSGFGTAPPANPSPVDLITTEYAIQVLAAGGITLSEAQAAILPPLITAASREIIRYCSRQFTLTTYTDLLTPEGGRQDRGEPATAKLSAFPVQSISHVLTGRTSAFTVRNTDRATNQFATVAFTLTGDVESFGLSGTGLTLSRTASGVTTTSTLTFGSHLTLEALANAINVLGDGWNATVQPSYALYPTTALVGAREPKNALAAGATLDLFTQPATSYDIDRASGIMRFYQGSGAGGFGGDLGAWGWGQYQVAYQAGWATIPENLQQVCAEVVKSGYARLDGDPTLKSESADKYSWTARDALTSLPEWADAVLMRYRSWNV